MLATDGVHCHILVEFVAARAKNPGSAALVRQPELLESSRAAGERPPPTVRSPAVLAGNQSGRIGLERRQEPRRCSSIDPRPQRFASRSEFKVATAAKKSRKARAFLQMETTRYAAA